MDITSFFSTSLGRRDQNPNKALGQRIVAENDREAVDALIRFVKKPESEDLLFDALKVMETIGELNSDLLKPAFDCLLPLLKHKTSKIQWMSISALSHITRFFPHKTFDKLETILPLMDAGGVITRDKGFRILLDLYSVSQYRETLAPLLEEQLLTAPDNQLGQYAEKWMEVLQPTHKRLIVRALELRSHELTNPSHQQRLAKNLKKLSKT